MTSEHITLDKCITTIGLVQPDSSVYIISITETDLNQIKADATRLVKTKLSESLGIGGLDRLTHNLNSIKTYLNDIKNEFDVIDIINSMPKAELKQLIESNKLVSELRYLSTKDYIMED